MSSEPSSVIDSYLPRCGFKDVAHFDTLRKSNPFVFRVYTPKERSPFSDDTDPYFVAPKFDELYARSPDDLKQISFTEALSGSYADVAKHMDWTTRSSSHYLSTSFSFGWAIWEAVKRYHSGMKKDVEIAIIDANALGGRAATAVELLLKSDPSERDDQFWKWHKFSKDSQSVLVYGFVPRSAVLASVPLLQILRKMPSYFLRDDIQILPQNPLTQAAWDYTTRKSSYRHFCQDMSKLFLSRPQEVRLRDTTGGAVRLALAFLRPYFHQVVQEDFDQAISHLRRLALIIARWPSESWIQEHPEVFNIVESMALSLGEELLYQGRTKSEEVSRLRFKIVGLEDALQSAHSSFYVEREHVRAEPESDEVSLPDNERMVESDEHTLVNSDLLPPISLAVKKPLSLETSVPIFAPRVPPAFQTPITPPESPRNAIFVPSTPTTSSEVPDVAPTTPPTRSSPWSSWVPPQLDITPPPRLGSPFKLLPAFELASPPTTPPPNVARHVVFSPPLLGPILETVVEVDPEREDENVVIVDPQPAVIEEHLHSIPEATDEEEEDDNEETGEEQSDDDKTDCEEEADTLPSRHKRHKSTDSEGTPGLQSPGIASWVHIRSSSALTSPRLSISSIDTLIDSPEYHPKRGSIAVSYPEPFSFLRRISSITMVEGRSRTVSFSGLSAATTEPVSEGEDEERERKSAALDDDERSPVDEHLNVPLPPSPSLSECTLSSLESESLDFPSPDSPRSPEAIASAPSTSGSEGDIRDDTVDVEAPVTTAMPVPDSPHDSIIPPKHSLGLLQPIEIDEDDEDALGRLSERTTIALADTASYIVTGFIVGAFITIFLFSTQRRALLSLT